jgi:predicted DNA-binding protein (MmcQ/YjbR family)
MNLEEVRSFCLALPGVTECLPFDEQTLVFKVLGKMFLLTDIETADRINVKCDPELALELRDRYPSITPGYHMNKTHWNTVLLAPNYPHGALKEWIRHSYECVLHSIPRRKRQEAGLFST